MLRRCVFALYLAGASCIAEAQTEAAELERIIAAIAQAEQKLAAARAERGTVASDIEARERNILEHQQQLVAIRGELDVQQRALEQARAQQQQLVSDSAVQKQALAAYARSAWMNGNEEYLKLLLNQDDLARAARLLRYYGYFSAARAEKLQAFGQTLDELSRVTADIEDATAALVQKQDELSAQQAELSAALAQRQDLLARLDSELDARGAALEQLEMDRIEIEILLQELQSSQSIASVIPEQEPFASRKGQLHWPLEGRHLNSFGARHNLGDLTWEGITIGAPAGSDVRAIHHGRVVFADWFTSSGLLLIIDHGDGYMSLYAHNQELFKAVGDWVAAGDVIAAAGNTGGQREAGVYFEIRRNGRAENPALWCKAH